MSRIGAQLPLDQMLKLNGGKVLSGSDTTLQIIVGTPELSGGCMLNHYN